MFHCQTATCDICCFHKPDTIYGITFEGETVTFRVEDGYCGKIFTVAFFYTDIANQQGHICGKRFARVKTVKFYPSNSLPYTVSCIPYMALWMCSYVGLQPI